MTEPQRLAFLTLLRSLEWSARRYYGDFDDFEDCCPSCGGHERRVVGTGQRKGHDDGCALAAAIEAFSEPGGPR